MCDTVLHGAKCAWAIFDNRKSIEKTLSEKRDKRARTFPKLRRVNGLPVHSYPVDNPWTTRGQGVDTLGSDTRSPES